MSETGLASLAGSSSAPRGTEETGHAILRIRSIILAAAVDCQCRAQIDEALQRLERLERRRENRRRLLTVRNQRRTIATLLDMLEDSGAVDAGAPDIGVIAEASLLFAGIAAVAQTGAGLLNEMLESQAPPA